MRTQRLAIVLTIVNLALLIVQLARVNPLSAEEPAPVVRARALQIVDDAGRVRASLAVLPAGDQSPEMVLLRLITEQGRPSVKISASEQSSVITTAGPTGTKNTWITLKADGSTSSVVVKSEDGSEQTIRP